MQDARDCLRELEQLAVGDIGAKRPELLGHVTDLFFTTRDARDPSQTEIFGDVMARIAFELDPARPECELILPGRFQRSLWRLAVLQIEVAVFEDDLVRCFELLTVIASGVLAKLVE